MRRRDRMISKVKSKYWQTSYKFGIHVPKTVRKSCEINKAMGIDFQTKAIEKEISNVRIAFEKLKDISVKQMKSGKIKPGFKEAELYIIFDIKIDGKFTRKARLVVGGRKNPPSSITYLSVVAQDSIRFDFLIVVLNNLDILACDINNTYLHAKYRGKLWTKVGSKFGNEQGSIILIIRALYGLKSSGPAQRLKSADTLMDIGDAPSESDRDVQIKRY